VTNRPATPPGGDRARGVHRRVHGFLIVCAVAAAIVGTIGQLIVPARGNPLLIWLDTAFVPALATLLFVLTRPDRPVLLAITLGLVYLEAVLTASLFAIGLAFSIVVPLIGIGLVGPRVRGRASIAAYGGAWAIATLSVVIAVSGNPPNPLGTEVPGLTALAFALVAAGAIGLLWRSSDQQVRALDQAELEITARIAATAEREQTAAFLETLIHSSPVATIALDRNGLVNVWNPAAVAMFGWTEAESLDHPLPAELVADGPLDQPGLGGLIARSQAGQAIGGDRVAARRRDGTEAIIEVHADARLGEAGQTGGIIVQAIDVTERMVLESRLRESQKLEAVAHLAGGIAHDINNALTAVGGFTEMIEAGAEDPMVKSDARTVAEGVQRASQLTRQLLAFAQRSVLQPQVIDAADFLESLEGDLQRLLGSEVAVAVRAHARPAWVHVDPGQFQQAVMSLAENARDTMPTGGRVTVTIGRREAPAVAADDAATARSTSMAGPVVVISVVDTGGGLEPELQGHAFEPYVTSDDHGPGGGLGLAMVHGFVAQSGGEIELDSEPGSGTSVEIRLPEAAQPPPPERRAERRMGRADPLPRSTGGQTILVIEDEPAVAEFCRRILVSLDYQVILAGDGLSAIEAATTHAGPIDLILSDVILPGMRGPEAVAAIQMRYPAVAVLYASGFTADAITERGVLPDGVMLVEKPFTAASLAERVAVALQDRRTTPEIADAV
jgi:two-component system cell cycle sensor histidine kinase/response regulator CckA